MSTTRAIPVSLKDRSDIDFSTSLGGTLYGTTPGGTKIVYDRNALLQYRNSPLSKTPPPQLAHITNTELNKKVEKSTTTPTTTTPPTTTAKPKPTNDDAVPKTPNQVLIVLSNANRYQPKPTTGDPPTGFLKNKGMVSCVFKSKFCIRYSK
ncbi:hypothetical protein ACTFIY_010047 [Dictyostelium cf. discoideum]